MKCIVYYYDIIEFLLLTYLFILATLVIIYGLILFYKLIKE